MAQTDDHMHVQGYVGTGKSSLVKSILSMFQRTSASVLVLAERRNLLVGVDLGRQIQAKTFASLAYRIIPQDQTSRPNRHMTRQTKTSWAPMRYADIIEHFGIMPSGKFSPDEIVAAMRGTVYGFCRSGDSEINAEHVPNRYASILDEVTKQVILHYATELWKETISPSSNKFKSSIRGYHRVKWAALNGWQIPKNYTHVLIDESHDLAKPMLQILDCSPQAVVSLGDEYQNLQDQSQQRSIKIRQREVANSVRSGCLIEDIVNPIIAIHPGKTKLPFYGNKLNKIEIIYYDKPEIPTQPVTILTNDMW